MNVTLDIPSILKESIATVRRQQILAVPVLAIPLLALLATPLLMRLAPATPWRTCGPWASPSPSGSYSTSTRTA